MEAITLSCDILRSTKYDLTKYRIRKAGTAIRKQTRYRIRQYTTILRLGSVVARIMPYPKVGMSVHTDCRQKPLLPRVRPNFLSCFRGSCGPLQAAIQLSLSTCSSAHCAHILGFIMPSKDNFQQQLS